MAARWLPASAGSAPWVRPHRCRRSCQGLRATCWRPSDPPARLLAKINWAQLTHTPKQGMFIRNHSDPVKTVGPFFPNLLLAQTSPPHVATAAWLWAWSCLVTHGFRRQAWTCPASLCTSRRSEVHWKLSRWSVQHRAVSSEQCFYETASKDSTKCHKCVDHSVDHSVDHRWPQYGYLTISHMDSHCNCYDAMAWTMDSAGTAARHRWHRQGSRPLRWSDQHFEAPWGDLRTCRSPRCSSLPFDLTSATKPTMESGGSYVCMYACMHAWMDGCMDVWMYGCMDGWMYVCVCLYVCMYVCMHGWMDGWMFLHLCSFIHLILFILIYCFIYACIYSFWKAWKQKNTSTIYICSTHFRLPSRGLSQLLHPGFEFTMLLHLGHVALQGTVMFTLTHLLPWSRPEQRSWVRMAAKEWLKNGTAAWCNCCQTLVPCLEAGSMAHPHSRCHVQASKI